MSHYHIIVAEERRTPRVTELGEDRSRMAFVMGSSIPTGNTVQGPMGETQEYVTGPEQLHHMGTLPEMLDDPQFVMVAEWDLQTPYVTVHKGDYSKRNLHFGGWPEITKEEYDEQAAEIPASI